MRRKIIVGILGLVALVSCSVKVRDWDELEIENINVGVDPITGQLIN